MSRWDVLVTCNWLDCESAALWDTPVLIDLSNWHFLVQKFYLGEAWDRSWSPVLDDIQHCCSQTLRKWVTLVVHVGSNTAQLAQVPHMAVTTRSGRTLHWECPQRGRCPRLTLAMTSVGSSPLHSVVWENDYRRLEEQVTIAEVRKHSERDGNYLLTCSLASGSRGRAGKSAEASS